MQDHIFSMIYVFNIWWNILNILQIDLKEILGMIFGPEALSSGSYQIFIQITKMKKFGKYLKYFIKEQSNISKEIFGCACGVTYRLPALPLQSTKPAPAYFQTGPYTVMLSFAPAIAGRRNLPHVVPFAVKLLLCRSFYTTASLPQCVSLSASLPEHNLCKPHHSINWNCTS